jgi:2-polyprenyl-6-methoxyphenol hydroxylase-like FAD-dependent oxidoreductase
MATAETEDIPVSVEQTACCIVGGGPGGMMLALLLVRQGIPVTLLEAHADFDREFRGDTIHPSILEVLDQIGLADRLLQLPHVKWHGPSLVTSSGLLPLVDFRRLNTRFPFIVLMPQERFLEFLAEEASRYPNFRLVLKANVQRLVEEGGSVQGVRFRGPNGWHEVRAALTVAADGRFSRIRHLAGIEPKILAPPMELLWFRIPRQPEDKSSFDTVAGVLQGKPMAVMTGPGDSAVGFVQRGPGFLMLVFNRIDYWQVGYIYEAGGFAKLRAAGVEAMRRSILALEPRLTPHLAGLVDWHQLVPLNVSFSRCRQWFKPGLLLIGDAAHVMTPAAGAGIKYAIEDAVEAANVLTAPLRSGRVRTYHLAEVQRRRLWPTRIMQFVGWMAQRNVLGAAIRSRRPIGGPVRLALIVRLLLRTPGLRNLPARFVGFGVWRVCVERDNAG